MKHQGDFLTCLVMCLVLGAVAANPCAAFAKRCEQWVAKAVSVQGQVRVQFMGQSEWKPVQLHDTFCPGDKLRTDSNSRADLTLRNQSVLRLSQNSRITLQQAKKERNALLDFFKGAAHFLSREPRSLKVRTPNMTAGVRGTELLLEVEGETTSLTIFEGEVLASNDAGSLRLTSGQSARAKGDEAPARYVVARPRDAVQWALHYPPVLYRPGEKAAEPGTSNFHTGRASQLLAVGSVEQARSHIRKALELEPRNSHAMALQTIMAIVQNDKEMALDIAQENARRNPESAAAHIALSYARQAHFNLEGAMESLQTAVQKEPENALAWARLAEMHSSFGRLGKALEAAQKAVRLEPSLSRTQTVLGFAYLSTLDLEKAKTAFHKAIELDQADPLPRLGLGLARIRAGNLSEGGREIEVAASLDPNNSLIRSYLGKTYYEQKRGALDDREFAIAKELDPKDPTPWFYDAIAKQTTNRPVQALHDIQKAKELNDNRAVYRSKLQLDSDLAARSASQARIYSDLGFQQRALVEGYKAVNTDPTNYSAHRFLADSYSVLPRHEIARVSELLQSQLLQPINLTPIQPSLAESDLYLISSSGPSSTSFNEFNPLFNRNRATVQASGIAGSDDTWGGEGVVAGIHDHLSMSAGYSHFETDGWRTNADQEDELANIFAQYEISPKTSVQAEYRYRKNERGDLELTFFEDDVLPYKRVEDETDFFRVGFRHSFVPGSDLIGNFQYSDKDRSLTDKAPDPEFTFPVFHFDLEGEDEAYGGELSYLLRSDVVNVVAGGGHFDIDAQDEKFVYLDFGSPPPLVLDESTVDADTNHTNLYLYTTSKPVDQLTLTLGGSGDFYESDDEVLPDEDQFNPKFGVTWELDTGTTLRAAAFRVLKRTLITDQTLEPTQVAGFNQFYDVDNGADYWRYGGAVDQKFSESLYGGVELTYRDLDFSSVDGTRTVSVNWKDTFVRSYLFWTPCNFASLTAEYQLEDLDRDEQGAPGAREAQTHSVPLGINLFHSTGLSASLKGTYYDQDGEFERKTNRGVFEDGDDAFWLFDASISYRLPKRYGMLTVGAKNLFDEEFEYFDRDWENPQIQPERFFFAKFTLSFPM